MAQETGSKCKALRRCSFAACSTSSGSLDGKTRRVSVAVNTADDATRVNSAKMIGTCFENYRVSRKANRRMNRSDEGFSCSQQSILSAMERFVKTVNNMNATVLVPSKLRDMDVSGKCATSIPPALANTDLYNFFVMLNDVKKELLWGPGTAAAAVATMMQPMTASDHCSPRGTKHIRQPSDDSLRSLGSTASSSDPETDSDVDSMLTDRDSVDEHSSHLAAAFRHHLQGLHTILHQLADSAEFLLSRYQEDVEASSL